MQSFLYEFWNMAIKTKLEEVTFKLNMFTVYVDSERVHSHFFVLDWPPKIYGNWGHAELLMDHPVFMSFDTIFRRKESKTNQRENLN